MSSPVSTAHPPEGPRVARPRDWLAGTRPRTLPASAVPVFIGSGGAVGYGHLSGLRGPPGPLRAPAPPRQVLAAAFGCFLVACVAGLVLAVVTSWWLIAIGAASVAAGWFYTGGSPADRDPRPGGDAGVRL